MQNSSLKADAKPFFTVVVPSYNREDFIGRTLKSIQNQVFSDFEVIVVDDCSTDHTVKKVEPFLNDHRFRLIRNPENFERAKSRNIGMMKAKGKFLTLLDSDDLMYPNCLQDAYGYSNANPEKMFFRNLYEMVDEKGKMLKKFDTVPDNDIKALAMGNFISCIGVFTHEKLYRNILFDEDRRITVSEDWEYWLRLRSIHPLGTIKKINSAFTEHPRRSISKFDPEEIERRKMLIIDKTLRNEDTAKIYGKYSEEMKLSAFVFIAVQANIAHKPKIALKYLKKAFFTSPLKFIHLRTMIAFKNVFASLFRF